MTTGHCVITRTATPRGQRGTTRRIATRNERMAPRGHVHWPPGWRKFTFSRRCFFFFLATLFRAPHRHRIFPISTVTNPPLSPACSCYWRNNWPKNRQRRSQSISLPYRQWQLLISGAVRGPIGHPVRGGEIPPGFPSPSFPRSWLEFRSIIHSTRGKVEYENKCTDVLAPVSFTGGGEAKFIILMGGSSRNLS